MTRFVPSPARVMVPVRSPALKGHARKLGWMIRRFALATQGALIRHREEILDCQLVQERFAHAAMELFASACVLSRWDSELRSPMWNRSLWRGRSSRPLAPGRPVQARRVAPGAAEQRKRRPRVLPVACPGRC